MTNSQNNVLIDTSTLFSGLGWTGPPYQVLLTISEQDNYRLVLSDWILDELFRHVQDFPDSRKQMALDSLRYLQKASIVNEKEWINHMDQAKEEVEDESDAPVLAAYFTDTPDYLVTSNDDDFPSEQYDTILTPKEFLDEHQD